MTEKQITNYELYQKANKPHNPLNVIDRELEFFNEGCPMLLDLSVGGWVIKPRVGQL